MNRNDSISFQLKHPYLLSSREIYSSGNLPDLPEKEKNLTMEPHIKIIELENDSSNPDHIFAKLVIAKMGFKNKLRDQIISEFDSEPIEDLVSHPVEEIISQTLKQDPLLAIDSILKIFKGFQSSPSILSGLIRCLGRLEHSLLNDIAEKIALEGLGHADVEVRDATVRAIEYWEEKRAIDVLRRHREEVSWLADYIVQVLNDITPSLPR